MPENEVLKKLLQRLEQHYGPLDNDTGCYVRNRWLSVAAIKELIMQTDEPFEVYPVTENPDGTVTAVMRKRYNNNAFLASK